MKSHVNVVNFLKLIMDTLRNVPLERRVQLMFGGFKTVKSVWMNKNALVGYAWLFVYESAHSYEEGMHVPPRLECND